MVVGSTLIVRVLQVMDHVDEVYFKEDQNEELNYIIV